MCLASATVAALAGCGGGGREEKHEGPSGIPVSCALVPLYAGPDQVRGFAERYLADGLTTIDAAEAVLRTTVTDRGVGAAATSTDAVATALHEAIHDEFAAGASLLVDGWIVSPSEANLAVAALASPPESC